MMYHLYQPTVKPPLDIKEVLHYAGMRECKDEALLETVLRLTQMIKDQMQPRCVYRILPILQKNEDSVVFEDGFTLHGKLVVKYLAHCQSCYVVIGTVGTMVDRMIAASSARSLLEGLLSDAAGSAAVEALMDDFCHNIPAEQMPKTRISPGYGDFPLEDQLSIFRLLDAPRVLGTCLNDSLLISPAKSVSAIVGCGKDYHV